MIRKTFEDRLASLTPRQEADTTALVEEYRKDLADVQSTALRYSQFPGDQGIRARSVISQLGETAVDQMGSAIAAQKPAPDTSLMIDFVKGVAVAETAVTAHLKA